MGVCVNVASLLQPPDSPPFRANESVRVEWLKNRNEVIRLICDHFDWWALPWCEPPAQYAIQGDCFNQSRYYKLLERARELDEISHSAQFVHLVNRDDSQYAAIYIPIEFDKPFQIRTSFEWEVCTIGSAVALSKELKALNPSVARYDDIADLPDRLLVQTEESVRLNVPMLIEW